MYLPKETKEELMSMGIVAKHYPRSYEEHVKRTWEKQYLSILEYYKDWDKPNVYTSFKSQEQLEKYARDSADMRIKHGYADKTYDEPILYIEYDGRRLAKKISVKSKRITTEMVVKWVEQDKKLYKGYYGEFTSNMQKLLESKGITGNFSIYPTTYGIGVFVFYNFRAEKEIKRVEEIMSEYGIEYENEYSDAQWVYRFKISKDKNNLAKIKKSL